MTHDTFRIGEVADLVSVPVEALAFWLKQGLLLDSSDGARKHRRFSRREVKIAAILGELRKYGINISSLRAVIVELRKTYSAYDLVPQPIPRLILDVLTHPETERLKPSDRISSADIAEAEAAVSKIPVELRDAFRRGLAIEDGDPLTLYFGPDGGASIFYGLPEDMTFRESDFPARSALVLHLQRIFDIDWPDCDDAGR